MNFELLQLLYIQSSEFYAKTSRKKKNQKSKSLPSITEQKCYTFTDWVSCDIPATPYTATFLHSCNSTTRGWWQPPQLTARPLALSHAKCHSTSAIYKLRFIFPLWIRNIQYWWREITILLILLMQATPTNSNFYIMECLGPMAVIPRWKRGQWHMWKHMCHGTSILSGAHCYLLAGSTTLNYFKPEPIDAALHYSQEKPTHTRRQQRCRLPVERTGKRGSATPGRMPKIRWERWSGPEPIHSWWSGPWPAPPGHWREGLGQDLPVPRPSLSQHPSGDNSIGRTIKQNHKNNSIRLKYQKCIKLLHLIKTVAAAQNLGGKARRQTYAEHFCEKLRRKSWAE